MPGAYNLLMLAASAVVRTVGVFPTRAGRPVPKTRRWVNGQNASGQEVRQLAAAIRADRQAHPGRPTVWLHASSMGEFQIARPLIAAMRAQCPSLRLVMTFFSPSGYENVDPAAEGLDHMLYLPLDTCARVRRFLDAAKPDAAVFMVAEYWHNYLHELHRRAIPTFLVSAHVGPKSIFSRWYGGWWRKALKVYEHIFAVDEASARKLLGYGARSAGCLGNPLWDNALKAAAEPWSDSLIEAFAGTGPNRSPVLVAGSLHTDDADLDLIARAVKERPNWKFIIVPHDAGPDSVARICSRIDGPIALYSAGAEAQARQARVMVVDTMGLLLRLYRHATRAYVGGGFTRKLHSVAEPAVYGLPVAFGPIWGRQSLARELLDSGQATSVADADALLAWLDAPAPAHKPAPSRTAAPDMARRILSSLPGHKPTQSQTAQKQT